MTDRRQTDGRPMT